MKKHNIIFNNIILSKVCFKNTKLCSREIVSCKVNFYSNKLPYIKDHNTLHAHTTAYQCVKNNFHASLYRNTN